MKGFSGIQDLELEHLQRVDHVLHEVWEYAIVSERQDRGGKRAEGALR